MKAVIIGANGQDGFYLTNLLIQKGVEVIGISRNGNFQTLDITNFEECSLFIKNEKPDFIFHLAANSTTNHNALFENHQTISTGTLNLLEAIKNYAPRTKVFISGSGLQFKNNGIPIKETDLFEANDAYSVSRIQSVYAARYFRSLGLKVYVGYFFNHDSPRRSERHVTKMISQTAKRIAAGSTEKLQIGDMSVMKEWSYAGDVVEGIWLLVNQENIFEANISSGLGYSIKEWIEICFSLCKIPVEGNIVQLHNFISGYKILVSDNSVIKSLGYGPQISFKELAKIMLENNG